MMKISIHIEIPRWLRRLFKCRHEIVSVESNPFSDYGVKESYLYCLKCGRQAGELESTCRHRENFYGRCIYCNARLSKFHCKHKWMKTDEGIEFCENCGEEKDKI